MYPNRRRRVWLLLCFCCTATVLQSQLPILQTNYAAAPKNSFAQMMLARSLAGAWRAIDRDSALYYLERYRAIANTRQETEKIADALQWIGELQKEKRNLDLELRAYLEAWTRLNNAGLANRGYQILGQIGGAYFRAGYNEVAKKYFESQLAMAIQYHEDYSIPLNILANLGYTCIELARESPAHFDSAQVYFEIALAISTVAVDSFRIGVACDNLGELALLRGDCGTAERCYGKSLSVFERLCDRPSDHESNNVFLGRAYFGLARVYGALQLPDSVIQFANAAEATWLNLKQDPQSSKLARLKIMQGNARAQKGQFAQAQAYMTAGQALGMAIPYDFKLHAEIAYDIAQFYTQIGAHAKAYAALQQSMHAQTKLHETSDRLAFFSNHADLVNNMLQMKLDHELVAFAQVKKDRNWALSVAAVLVGLCLLVLYLLAKLKGVHDHQKADAAALKVLIQSKDKLISVFAHDLRSPFHTLMGLTDQAQHQLQRQDLAQVQASLQILHTVSQETYYLFENLLSWAKSQTGQLHFQPQPIDLTLMFAHLLELFRAVAESKQLKIHLHVAICWAMGDQQMVSTMLRNVIGNAVKFSRRGGEIWIWAAPLAGKIQITVEDQGPGLSAELQTALAAEWANGMIGKGLGLSLVNEFVKQHGGRLFIESSPGAGARFTLQLPAYHRGSPQFSQPIAKVELAGYRHPAIARSLQPYLCEFQQVQIYENSKIKRLLQQVNDRMSPEVQEWKCLVLRAMDQYDTAAFDALLGRVSSAVFEAQSAPDKA